MEFFIHDAQWRLVATYRQEPAPAFVPDEVTPTPRGPTNPNPSLPTARPAPLLYERYVYYARGIGGRSDIKGPDQPILRQRFKYYRTVQVPVLDENGEPTAVTQTHNVEIECFAPGTTETIQGVPPTAYTRGGSGIERAAERLWVQRSRASSCQRTLICKAWKVARGERWHGDRTCRLIRTRLGKAGHLVCDCALRVSIGCRAREACAGGRSAKRLQKLALLPAGGEGMRSSITGRPPARSGSNAAS